MANRLRVHDSDFLVEDLNNSNNEPQWFQELTNNYKLIYLKKFLHLLPSDDSNNQLVVNEAPQQELTIPQVQSENLNLNITTKNEPKSAVPSPVPPTNSMPSSINQYQPMQPVVQNSIIDNRTIENDLNFEMNKLDLNTNNQMINNSNQYEDQSATFYPQFQEQQDNQASYSNQYSNQPIVANADLSVPYTNNQEQADQINFRRYTQDPPPMDNRNFLNNTNQSTRNLSTSSSNNNPPMPLISNLSQSENNLYQTQVFNPNAQQNNYIEQQRRISEANIYPPTLNDQPVFNKFDDNSRPRKISTSTIHNDTNQHIPFTPFNPYQSVPKTQKPAPVTSAPQQFFDPNVPASANKFMPRSSTFPAENLTNQPQFNPVKQEQVAPIQNQNIDEDDEFSAANPKRKDDSDTKAANNNENDPNMQQQVSN